MNFREMVKEQLGENYSFKKSYTAFENSEIRVIVTDEYGREYRYIIVDGRLVEK